MNKTAEQMLLEATGDTSEADVDRALHRADEMFDAAPWLSRSATHVPGCANLAYTDLFSLTVAAGLLRRQQKFGACEPAPAPYRLCRACGDEPAVGDGSKHPDHCSRCGAQQ